MRTVHSALAPATEVNPPAPLALPAAGGASEAARLQALHAYEVLDTPPEQAYEDLVALAASICETPVALFGLLDEHREWFKARHGLDMSEQARDESICPHAIAQPGTLFVIEDMQADPRTQALPLVQREQGMRFYAAAPLRNSEGHALGVLCVADTRPRTLNAAQAASLQALGRQVMAQLSLRRRTAELGRALERQQDVLQDQRVLQAALAEREQRFARLAEQVPGVVHQFQLRADGSYCFPYASEGLKTLFGVSPAEVLDDGSAVMLRIHPEDRLRVEASILESARTLQTWEGEYRTQIQGQPERWLQGRSKPERLPDGSVLWHGFISDISARKLEEQRRREQEAVMQQAQRLARLGSWRWQREQLHSEWSEQTCRLFGIDPENRVVADQDFMRFVHPEDAEEVMRTHLDALAGLRPYAVQYRIRAADGVERTLQARAEFLREPGTGEIQGMVGTLLDVSERVAAERELQRHRDELERLVEERTHELIAAREKSEQASRAKGDFLSSMSHELRTPMNAILGFAQLLQLDRQLDARSAGFVQEILRAGQHLLQLINEVLDLARIESGKLSLSPEPLPLAEPVAEARALVTPLAQQRQVALNVAALDGLVVRADRLRLKQVLLNLLSNAVKYNRPGGAVYVDAQEQDLFHVRLRVRDTGIGIAPQHMKELFQPFSRISGVAAEGTGIGLSISQRLVAMMGGRIGVESKPGVGSEFWIELPSDRLADPPPPLAGSAEAANAQPPLPQGRRACVLYVEDNPANLKLVEQIVARHAGVELLMAPTGSLGLDLARSHQPDLVLLDIHLPDMDGFQVLARLRADEATRHIPAVAVTAQAMPADVRRVHAAGFDDYLAKPLELRRFDELLAQMLLRGPRS